MKYSNTDEALIEFEEAAQVHDEANRSGNYKKGNKANDRIRKALKYLWHNDRFALSPFLSHKNTNVKLWAAMFWLEINSEHAMRILDTLASSGALYSTEAKYCISEWKAGNLTSNQWE